MPRLFTLRSVAYLALLLPLAACFAQVRTVGSDDAGGAPSPDGGVTAPDGGTCTPPLSVCQVVPIPSSCHYGPATCPGGVYECPQIVCDATDAGAPAPDAGCGGGLLCPAPAPGSGCFSVGGSCTVCPTIVCPPDAGGPCGDGGPLLCKGPPPGCQAVGGGPSCINGVPQCPTIVCGAQDAGGPSFFPCTAGGLSTDCDATTQYCQITEGGPIQPDGGTPASAACLPIPAACAAMTGAAECACLGAGPGGTASCTTNSVNGATVTIAVP